MLGYRVRGQQSPNTDNAKVRLYTKSSRLRLLLLTRLRRRKNQRRKKREKKKTQRCKGAKAQRRKKKEVREEEGGRKERSVSHPSSPSCCPSCVYILFLFFPLRLCAFAPLH